MNTISVKELADRSQKEKVHLIDVRMPAEFGEVHATDAINVPLDSLDPAEAMRQYGPSDSSQPLYVMCKSGGRSSMACKQFHAAGIDNVVSVDGGTLAWAAASLPVKRGKKAVSLERQVRIAAGFLVLLGAVLGMSVHIGFVGLSAFVGAGLMFAGITDTCGMGMMLAKMPWNRSVACQTK